MATGNTQGPGSVPGPGALPPDLARQRHRLRGMTLYQKAYLLMAALAAAYLLLCRFAFDLPGDRAGILAPAFEAWNNIGRTMDEHAWIARLVLVFFAVVFLVSIPARRLYPSRMDLRDQLIRRFTYDPRGLHIFERDCRVMVRRRRGSYLVRFDLAATSLDEDSLKALVADVFRSLRMERNELRPCTGPLKANYTYEVEAEAPFRFWIRRWKE